MSSAKLSDSTLAKVNDACPMNDPLYSVKLKPKLVQTNQSEVETEPDIREKAIVESEAEDMLKIGP